MAPSKNSSLMKAFHKPLTTDEINIFKAFRDIQIRISAGVDGLRLA